MALTKEQVIRYFGPVHEVSTMRQRPGNRAPVRSSAGGLQCKKCGCQFEREVGDAYALKHPCNPAHQQRYDEAVKA